MLNVKPIDDKSSIPLPVIDFKQINNIKTNRKLFAEQYQNYTSSKNIIPIENYLAKTVNNNNPDVYSFVTRIKKKLENVKNPFPTFSFGSTIPSSTATSTTNPFSFVPTVTPPPSFSFGSSSYN